MIAHIEPAIQEQWGRDKLETASRQNISRWTRRIADDQGGIDKIGIAQDRAPFADTFAISM